MGRAANYLNPMNLMSFGFEQQKLTMASLETVWHRTAQMAAGKMSPTESMAMWMEKPTAVASGFEKAAIAAAGGKGPAQIMEAAFAPMTAKASSNAKRLRK